MSSLKSLTTPIHRLIVTFVLKTDDILIKVLKMAEENDQISVTLL